MILTGRAGIPNPVATAWCNASNPRFPPAKSAVPLGRSLPSERMNSILGVKRTASESDQASRNHGAIVPSGASAIPLPCSKNLSIHDLMPFRPPNGGFIQTKPVHCSERLSRVRNALAGTEVVKFAGAATSRSNPQPRAVNM